MSSLMNRSHAFTAAIWFVAAALLLLTLVVPLQRNIPRHILGTSRIRMVPSYPGNPDSEKRRYRH